MTQAHDTLPTPWRLWLLRLLPALGTALVLAAVIYFFAANWQRIPAAVRLALVEGGLVLAVGAWLVLRRRAFLGADAALTAAGVLVGVFWAVFGQIYQTGADAWQLFALWALGVAPWLPVRPATALWALWVTVLNIALVLWSAQTGVSGGWSEPPLLAALAADTALWAACLGVARVRPGRRDKAELFAWIVLPFALGCATVLVCAALLGSWGRYADPVAWPRTLAGLAVLLVVALYAARARRAFPLFLLALCGYPLLNCALLHLVDDSSVGSILVWYTAGNLGYTLFAVKSLLRLRPVSARNSAKVTADADTGAPSTAPGATPGTPAGAARDESLLSHLLGGLGGGLSALFLIALGAYGLAQAGFLHASGVLTTALIFTTGGLAASRRAGSFARTLALVLLVAGFAFLAFGLADRYGLRNAAAGVALATAVLYPWFRHAGWRFVSVLGALVFVHVAFASGLDLPFSSTAARALPVGHVLALLYALPLLFPAWGKRPSATLRPALCASLLAAALYLPAWSPLYALERGFAHMAAVLPVSPELQPLTPFTVLCGLALLVLLVREGRGRLTPVRGGAAGLGLIVVLALAPVEAVYALVLTLTGHARRWRLLEVLGLVLLGVFLSGYYYLLSVPLLTKAFSIGLPGLALLAGTALVPAGPPVQGQMPDARARVRRPAAHGRDLTAVVLLLMTLAAFQYAVYDKERLMKRGDVVLLALAPVDPRSLLQGDYMELAYEVENRLGTAGGPSRGYAVLRLDEQRVGRLAAVRAERGDLAPGEYAVPYRERGWNTELRLPHSFLFEEGQAERYAQAAYGILRCAPAGDCLLTGLADEHGRPVDAASSPDRAEKQAPVAALPNL